MIDKYIETLERYNFEEVSSESEIGVDELKFAIIRNQNGRDYVKTGFVTISFPVNADENTGYSFFLHGAGANDSGISEEYKLNPLEVIEEVNLQEAFAMVNEDGSTGYRTNNEVSVKYCYDSENPENNFPYGYYSSGNNKYHVTDKDRIDFYSQELFVEAFGDNSKNTTVTFSAGDKAGIYGSIEYIQKNTNVEKEIYAERQILAIIDAKNTDDEIDGAIFGTLSRQTENVNTLKENGALIIAFEQTDANLEKHEQLTKTGVQMIVAKIEGNHGVQLKSFYERDVFDFLNGSTSTYESLTENREVNYYDNGPNTLEQAGYKFEYYDRETGKWIEIDPKTVQDIINLKYTEEAIKFFTNYTDIEGLKTIKEFSEALNNSTNYTIKNNSDFILENYEALVNAVKLLSLTIDMDKGLNYQSTTKVPSENVSILNSIRKVNRELLNDLIIQANNIYDICTKIEQLDQGLENETNEINIGGIN